MKKILGIVFLISLWSNIVSAQSMTSLKDYIIENENNIDDIITQSYVLKRCGAVYLFAASITKDVNPKISKNFAKAYGKVMMLAGQGLMLELGWSEEEAAISIERDLKNMLKYYQKDGYDSFSRTGKYMENNYIGEDLTFCKGVAEAAN